MNLQSLEGRYAPMLAIALFALVPYILVASGGVLYRPQIVSDLDIARGTLSVIEGISTAGYAFGALMAGDLVNRFSQRHLFLTFESLFIVGWLTVGLSEGAVAYGAGRILAGLATGLLLVTAIPPIVRRFPSSRLPFTAVFINIGFFGAITGGPLLGGVVEVFHAWRGLYLGFAGLGVVTLSIAALVLPKTPPMNPDLPFDGSALVLGLAATLLPFWASGELAAHGFASAVVAVPMVVGLCSFVALLIVEYRKKQALSPVTMAWTTFPLVGIAVASIGGGAFLSFALLTIRFLTDVLHDTPFEAGLTFWPQLAGAIVTAILLGLVFRTRYLPILALSGMLVLIAGGVVLMLIDGRDHMLLLAGIGLLGLGAGATVTPGLFMAGFSLPTQYLGRIFALIELVRSVADFILAPVTVQIAKTSASGSATQTEGIHQAMLLTLIVAAFGLVVCIALFLVGGARLQRPDIEGWVNQKGPAIQSPLVARALRNAKSQAAKS